MPLNSLNAQEFFKQWGLDFVGPLKASKARRCRYIVVATEYFTTWIEAWALPNNSTISTAKNFYEQIITRYGIPKQLTTNQGDILSIASFDCSQWSSKYVILFQAHTT